MGKHKSKVKTHVKVQSNIPRNAHNERRLQSATLFFILIGVAATLILNYLMVKGELHKIGIKLPKETSTPTPTNPVNPIVEEKKPSNIAERLDTLTTPSLILITISSMLIAFAFLETIYQWSSGSRWRIANIARLGYEISVALVLIAVSIMFEGDLTGGGVVIGVAFVVFVIFISLDFALREGKEKKAKIDPIIDRGIFLMATLDNPDKGGSSTIEDMFLDALWFMSIPNEMMEYGKAITGRPEAKKKMEIARAVFKENKSRELFRDEDEMTDKERNEFEATFEAQYDQMMKDLKDGTNKRKNKRFISKMFNKIARKTTGIVPYDSGDDSDADKDNNKNENDKE